jgi:RecA/RadA recombinase
MPVDPDKRAEYIGWLAGRATGSKIYHGESQLAGGTIRIPFVSPLLTWATTGGVPVGHMARWYGPEGSGKSLVNWGISYCAQNYPRIMSELMELEIKFWEQRKQSLRSLALRRKLKSLLKRFPDGMGVVLFDTEQRAQLDFAAKLGVNTHKDHFLLIEENIIEEIIEEMSAAMEAYHVIIIDSASNAQSYAEANLEPGEYERGTAAAAWKRLRKVRKRMDREDNTIIIVDQVRTQLGQQSYKGQSPVTPPNIRFLRHNASIAVAFSGAKHLYLNDSLQLVDDKKKASNSFMALGSDGHEVAGIEMRCKIDKNSTGKPFRNAVGRFKFDVADARTGELVQEMSFDQGFELLTIAEYFHIIESSGGGMFYVLDDKFKRTNQKWKGEWRAIDGIKNDDELVYRILSRLRMAI